MKNSQHPLLISLRQKLLKAEAVEFDVWLDTLTGSPGFGSGGEGSYCALWDHQPCLLLAGPHFACDTIIRSPCNVPPVETSTPAGLLWALLFKSDCLDLLPGGDTCIARCKEMGDLTANTFFLAMCSRRCRIVVLVVCSSFSALAALDTAFSAQSCL